MNATPVIYASTYPPPILNTFFNDRSGILLPFLFISMVIGLFTDFVIWTQSRSLGTYKYYLLNQTLWSQLLEILTILLNPVFLTPYFAGYMGGLLRTFGTYELTVTMTCVCFCLVSNVIISVVLSLINRFILTFHQEYRTYLENKYTIGGLCTFLILFYIGFSILFYASGTDGAQIRQIANVERPGAFDDFFSEASFVYLKDLNGTTRQVWFIFFICFLAQAVLLLLSVTWFVYNVFLVGKKTKIISKTSKSLVISSVFQAFICVVFLFLPVLWVVGSGAFNLQDSANVSNALVTLISLHGTIDMLTTLYFVVPYRKFCKRLLFNKKVSSFTIKIRHPTL